jgi:uncharacterized protein YcfJ
MRRISIVLLIVAAALAPACSSLTREEEGTAAGAVMGALVGSLFGEGAGGAAAIAVGAVAGGVAGNLEGRDRDEADRRKARRATLAGARE